MLRYALSDDIPKEAGSIPLSSTKKKFKQKQTIPMNTKDFYPTNFNPSDWLKSENKASSAAAPSSSGVASPTSREDDATRVKALIEALQASHVDLTASYDNWLHVGFAPADTFGLSCL